MEDNNTKDEEVAKQYMESFFAKLTYIDFIKNFQSISKTNSAFEQNIVVRLIDDIIEKDSNFHDTIKTDKPLYRARRVDPRRHFDTNATGISAINENERFISTGFNSYESKEPPLTVPQSARNNIRGMSYLYASEDQYTACAEIRPNKCLISLAEFEVKRDIQVINLCNDHNVSILNEYREKYGISPAVLMTDIMDTYRNPDYDGSVYLITQFISDRIRKSGIDGIKFKSSITNGNNVTVFNSHDSIISWKSSKLVYAPGPQYQFVDLNAGTFISAANPIAWEDSYTKAIRETLVEEIRKATNTSKIENEDKR